MKRIYLSMKSGFTRLALLAVLALLLSSTASYSQCTTCPSYDASLWPDATYQTTGSIVLAASQCRIFRVFMAANTSYRFSSCEGGGSYANDIVFELLDASCAQVAYSDDFCGVGSQLDYTATTSGYRYFKVRGYGLAAATLDVAYKYTAGACVACPAYDSQITPTATYQTASDLIGLDGCKKYRVDMLAGYTYRFSMCEGGGVADFDTYLTVLDGSCVTVSSNDDFCGLQSQVDYTPTVSGTYYIEANSCCTGGNGGSYTLAYKYTYDPCVSIVTIPGTGAANTMNATTNANMTGAGWNIATCGYSTPGEEKMYQFTPTVTGPYSLVVTSVNGTYFNYLYKDAVGGCNNAGWTCIVETAFPGTYGPITLTAGTNYYFLLDDEFETSANDHYFYLDLQMCATAINIPSCGAASPVTYTSSAAGAFSVGTCGYSTPGVEQLYTFTAPYTASYSIEVTTASGIYVDYFWKDASLGCDASGWTCIDDVYTTGTYGAMTLTGGTTYLIMLDAESTSAVSQTFNLSCPPPPPVNDNCADATIIGAIPYSSGLQSTVNATSDSPAGMTACVNPPGKNVWYVVTGTGNLMEANSCDALTNFDTEIHIYTGSCGTLTDIACDDDGCGTNKSNVQWCSTLGTTYYINIGYYDNGSPIGGDYVLAVVDYALGTPSFTLGATSTRCQAADFVTYDATAANSTGINYVLDATSLGAGNTIDALTGAVTYVAGWSGTSTITADAAGCNATSTANHTVTITPTVGTPTAITGISDRCIGAGTNTAATTATDNTGFNWTMSPPSAGSIGATDGMIIWNPTFTGTATVEVTANGCNGPSATTSASVDVNVLPVVSLGIDQTTCANLAVTLNAGAFSGYLWSTGQTTPTIVVDTLGNGIGATQVWVEVTDVNTCVNRDTVTITFDPCTGISETGNGEGLSVYPVPSTGVFNLQFTEATQGDVLLKVMDVTGRLIYSNTVSGIKAQSVVQINLVGEAKGTYYLMIQTNDSSVTRKLVIN